MDIHTFWVGSLSKFAQPFKDNEALYNQARAFWRNLEGCSPFLTIAFVVISLALAWYYYFPFNNQPGRHYRVRYWLGFGFVAAIVTLIASMVIEYAMATPKLDGALAIEVIIAIFNALYSFFAYIVVSLVFCKCFTTNAYPFYKKFSK